MQVADLTLAKLFLDDGDGLNGAVAFGECPTYIAPEVLRATMHPKTAPADNKGKHPPVYGWVFIVHVHMYYYMVLIVLWAPLEGNQRACE